MSATATDKPQYARTSAHVLVSMLDVEVHLVGDLGALRSLNGLRDEESRNSHSKDTSQKTSEKHGDEGKK